MRFHLSLLSIVTLFAVPSVVQAQYAVVSPCGYDCARISVIPAPPTGVPAWLQPGPVAPPAPPVPPLTLYPAPVYIAPVPAGRGIDPWIPLAVRPPAVQSPLDVMTQLLLIQQLAAEARARQQQAPAYVAPAPAPSAVPRDGGWMRGFIKGVK